jgi:hypothetical protein
MPESNVLNPAGPLAGGGGGGQYGRQGDSSRTGDPPDDDLSRLARMIERISFTLQKLVLLEPKILPENLAANFASVWPEVQDNLTVIVKILRQELILAEPPVNLVEALQKAGLTGPMLLMKQNSLFYYLNNIDSNLMAYEQIHATRDKPILSYPESKGIFKTLLGWVKPGFKVINSILGSLPDVFGSKEMIKEFKEHVEAGYEVGEQLAEQREAK